MRALFRLGTPARLGALLFAASAIAAPAAQVRGGTPDPTLVAAVEAYDVAAIRSRGERTMAPLLELYRTGDVARRTQVAVVLYGLGWKSEEAARLLLADVHTDDPDLRLQVQWALGRVSDSPVVVETLLANMMNDPNPLFRDKAACALANDQIHLSEPQKVRLFEGLIDALDDPKPQVRRIAIQALKVHTGQTKGFVPVLPEEQRTVAIAKWRAWLDDYRAAL